MPNPTMIKFGYPETLIKELDHWAILLRPEQVTLGSLVLASRSDATAYSDLSDQAFAEQAVAVRMIEAALREFCRYERLNYLMLMMVDPNVHFHVIPRYSEVRKWQKVEFSDQGWPGPPALKPAVSLAPDQASAMRDGLKQLF
ncbi:MAG TPA: HIT family protein [Sphingomicrobium sp.]|nr:HIT family protein [Sphingomicrobium sp.]